MEKMFINRRLFLLPLIIGLIPRIGLSISGTPSVQATFTSTIEAGTCIAQVKNGAGGVATAIEFNDVFKSDLKTKSRIEPFTLAFSQCSGVRSAAVTTQYSTCDGTGQGNAFLNSGTSVATAVEIWRNAPDSGTQFRCVNQQTNSQSINISGATANMGMSARMVVASGRNEADVTAGDFIVPLTFVITYQ